MIVITTKIRIMIEDIVTMMCDPRRIFKIDTNRNEDNRNTRITVNIEIDKTSV